VQFQEVIRLQPKDSGGYYALGQTYRAAGKLDAAQEQLDKALAIEGDFTYAHFERGMLYAEQQKIDLAKGELAILSQDAPELVDGLQGKINEKSAPRFLNAYTTSLNLASLPGAKVSSLDSSLATSGAEANFTVKFIFDKDMDPASVQNVANWTISRSTSYRTGGLYNWGIEAPSTEISISPMPENVIYDPQILTAKVTFTIAQNSSGDGTIDLSHLVFKFNGTDTYGNSIDTSADEYNMISMIV
jgi:tetratricopeptide (TPR) repeat protein